jgi:hypothetical protein
MSNNKQSSVEWLVNRIKHLIPDDIGSQLFLKSQQSKAKAMHKEEVEDAWDKGDYCIDLPDGTWEQKYKSAEQYYNETFGE